MDFNSTWLVSTEEQWCREGLMKSMDRTVFYQQLNIIVVMWKCVAVSGDKEWIIWYLSMELESVRNTHNILERNLCRSANKTDLGSSFIFQCDDDPKHYSPIVTECLDQNYVNPLNWPSQGLDLNPTEHLWSELDLRLRKRHRQEMNKN